MKQGDIYIANLNPVKGNEQRGIRPIVIISGNAMNDHLGIVIVMPLTSKTKNYSGCLVLEKNNINNLTSDSEIITFQIRAISKDRLINKIGTISKSEIDYLKKGLQEILKY
ncbi:MAG: type II toxin-antitoxin system PemK/MazF family toxin [Bacteroidetes bacterium]|nr:MAG: type II toxin-antitoxin system PemK/MazF family toxin [Bacteroidota bacterium]